VQQQEIYQSCSRNLSSAAAGNLPEQAGNLAAQQQKFSRAALEI
jgi:hypothetical protein